MSDFDIDGATVTVGDVVILVQSEGGEPMSLDHVSGTDGYAAYDSPGDKVTLQFLEVPDDE